jgi:hypothetical protein
VPAGAVSQIENSFRLPLFQQFNYPGHIRMRITEDFAALFKDIIPGIGLNFQFTLQIVT